MKRETKKPLDEQRRVVAYLDGLYPDGHLRQAKVNAPRELQSASGKELFPALRFGNGAQSALMPSILDKLFKGEL